MRVKSAIKAEVYFRAFEMQRDVDGKPIPNLPGHYTDFIFHGYFHQWFTDGDWDLQAIVQTDDGLIQLISHTNIKFEH